MGKYYNFRARCLNIQAQYGTINLFILILSTRAKDQLLVDWDTGIKRLRTQLTQFLTQSAEDTTVKEVSLSCITG